MLWSAILFCAVMVVINREEIFTDPVSKAGQDEVVSTVIDEPAQYMPAVTTISTISIGKKNS